MNRRDLCYVIGRRMNRLNMAAAGTAWAHLAGFLEGFGEPSSPHYKQSPKFRDLIGAMRVSNIIAHQSASRVNAIGIYCDDGTVIRRAEDLAAEDYSI